jgi:RHS repeat-associated protein
MQQPVRGTMGISDYRYGFNGKEKDNEITGNGNQIAYEARIYDARIGRFLSCDPLEKVYPWQSAYVFAHNNPIKLIDVMGMAGADPTPIYHRTSSANAANISINGFDPTKSNRNAFTYFSTTPEIGSIGNAAASGNTLINGTLDISNARTITKQQMTTWFNQGFTEANKQLNTKYSSMTEVPNELQYKYQSIADGIRNSKLADFMKADGGEIYNIISKRTIAVAESAIGKVKITGLSGSGASEAIQMMTRPSLNGESASALARYGRVVNTIKWGGRACIAVAIAADVYDIYQSDNRMRTLNIKVGGWAGAIAGATYGAEIGAGGGSILPGGGNVAGGLAGGVVGGIVGYWAGSTSTQVIYDYLFTKGVTAK